MTVAPAATAKRLQLWLLCCYCGCGLLQGCGRLLGICICCGDCVLLWPRCGAAAVQLRQQRLGCGCGACGNCSGCGCDSGGGAGAVQAQTRQARPQA